MFCSLFCERIELIPTTAENINKHIASFKGEKAVLLNIWALWCAPCIEEFPMIVNLHFCKDQFQDVINFLKNHNVGTVSYIKSQKDEIFINGIHDDWSGSLPFTLIYAKKSGKIVDYWEGIKKRKKHLKRL